MEPHQKLKFESFPQTLHSREMLDKISELGSVCSFKKDEVIINDQSYIRSIPIVTKGTIKVLQGDDDYRELFLYHIHPGETCIMSFLGGMQQEKSRIKAVAETPVEVLMIPIENAVKLVTVYPEWVEYIFRIYHKRFEELLDVVNEVTFKKMDERLLQFLQKKAGVNNARSVYITHEEIAHELGTSRVVISRLLKQLENDGHIKLGRNRIQLM